MGGTLLVLFGLWVLVQVGGGNALGRLGVSGTPTQPGSKVLAGQQAGAKAGDVIDYGEGPHKTGMGG